MSTKVAKESQYRQAKSVVNSLERILEQINWAVAPQWLLAELQESSRKAQCIQAEFERQLSEVENG